MAERIRVSKMEEAITILMKEYYGKLGDEEILNGISIFEQIQKSGAFVVLRAGPTRDRWL
jgi:hypothetical protein